MQAFTQEELARVQTGLSLTRTPVEPSTSYTVGRVRREFANQSSIGVMLTATKRSTSSGLAFLPDTALTSGLDWDLRFKTRYSLTGYLAGSDVRGEPEAIQRIQENSRHYFQRPGPDAATSLDPTRRSLTGSAGSLGISKIGGKHVRFNSNVGFKTPGLRDQRPRVPAARRPAHHGQLAADSQRHAEQVVPQPDTSISTSTRRGTSTAIALFSGGNVNAHATFVNNWEHRRRLQLLRRSNSTIAPRAAARASTRAASGRSGTTSNTDSRRPLTLNYFVGGGSNGEGQTFADFNPSVTYRPLPALTINPGIRFSKNTFGAQWVDNLTEGGDHYVFGELDQTTVAMTMRLNYTMTPNLSLQLYAEPFVSAGDYSAFKELVNGRSRDFDQRYAPFAYNFAPDDNPSFNEKSFRTTNVLRWEYKPGSTLFVVWQQARENDVVPGGFRFGRDVRDIFGVPPRNTFLVKLAYWLNY